MQSKPPDKMIKGTMVCDVVKTIKKFKDQPWELHLSEDARRLLAERVLPSVWYPYEPVLECVWAVYRLLGKSNPEIARLWGKSNGRRLFETIYQNLTAEKDTTSALEKLELIYSRAFSRASGLNQLKLATNIMSSASLTRTLEVKSSVTWFRDGLRPSSK
jgi:hypothetical protein